jgi:hypothetical protein
MKVSIDHIRSGCNAVAGAVDWAVTDEGLLAFASPSKTNYL